MALFNAQDREEQVETALYFLCYESMRKRERLHFDTERAYKHFNIAVSSGSRGRRRLNLQLPVIIIAVHEMDFEAVE